MSGHELEHAGHALGKVDFPVSCSQDAQAEFNRALALLHHMTYPQAREAFERVAAIDPRCAMAHWGIATTLFQPLWPTRPRPAELQRGWDEVQRAKALAPPTERERLFIATAEAFFLEPASTDYWLRIRRWAEALEKLHTALPDDPEAAAFYALSLLATTPANAMSREHADRAAEILVRVYAQNPDHPGAMHYLVHSNDVPGRERELLEITRKYEAAAPNNPHALHMPTHIYTRLGDWDGVIRGNLRAADAALEYPAGDHGEFVWDEFPHAIEYLVYAYLQKGDFADAAAAARAAAQYGAHRTDVQDRLPPGFDAGPLRTGTARLARGGRHRSARTRLPGLGPLSVGRGDLAVRARARRRSSRQAGRGAGGRYATRGTGGSGTEFGRGAVCPEHRRAAARTGGLERARGRP